MIHVYRENIKHVDALRVGVDRPVVLTPAGSQDKPMANRNAVWIPGLHVPTQDQCEDSE